MCSLKSKSRSNAGSNRQREVSVYSTGPISSAQINKPKPCIAIFDSIILWTRELWRFLGGNSISVFTSAMEQVVPKKIPSPQPNHHGRVKQHIAGYYKAHDRLIGLAGLSQNLYRSICPSGAGAERMRSFRHLPELSYRHHPWPHFNDAEIWVFSMPLPLPPGHSVQIQLVTFLAWKKNTPV